MDEDLVILELNARWGCDIPFGWIPLSDNHKQIPHTEVYNDEAFHEAVSDTDLRGIVRKVFQAAELYEVVEGGTVSRKSLDDCFFGYDGLEHLHTNATFDFVLYFSHEESVTVGGLRLLDAIHELWPDHANHPWPPPY
jgi:hypothetical protein